MINGKKKTAVVYDKWLGTLGGGEVVACTIAKLLKEKGYNVTFITGKEVSLNKIRQKLRIDLTGIKFIQAWNDELKIKECSQGKDLFVNTSFMDYTRGFAKQNIYYTHFPTESYINIRSYISNNLILPVFSNLIKPAEIIDGNNNPTMINGNLGYRLKSPIKIAFSNLNINKPYMVKFLVFLEKFNKNDLGKIDWQITGGKITKHMIKIDHHHNIVRFIIVVKPSSKSVYLDLSVDNIGHNRAYFLFPKIFPVEPFYILHVKRVFERLKDRLRAGLFTNILERLDSYELILANSQFTAGFIKKYWKREAGVLYPPTDLLFRRYNISEYPKKNWICSVGRFFTLGHGKKQEVMIRAFKDLYDRGYKNWELHLVGGLGQEPTSIKFADFLKKEAEGYPVFFHFNASRKEVENVLLNSRIYWHATGFEENENKNPIKFEHFGIAPIEAISAGCIPVLYNGGGLKEIQTLLGNKIKLFSSEQDLIDATKEIANNSQNNIIDRKIMEKTERYFSKKAFIDNFSKFID